MAQSKNKKAEEFQEKVLEMSIRGLTQREIADELCVPHHRVTYAVGAIKARHVIYDGKMIRQVHGTERPGGVKGQTPEFRQRVFDLSLQGLTQQEVADALAVPIGRVSYAIAKIKKDPAYTNRCGRKMRFREAHRIRRPLAPEGAEREAYIIAARERGETLKQIADHIGVTKERVRQILLRAKHYREQSSPAT